MIRKNRISSRMGRRIASLAIAISLLGTSGQIISAEGLNGWIRENGSWYYYQDGDTITGWKYINGKWYYMDSTGKMKTGWLYLNGNWYYMNSSGEMKTGWINLGGTWYYLKSSGEMVKNAWVGDYYLTASGAMARSTWIGSYYVDASGKWDKTRVKDQNRWIQEGSRWWYRHADGSYTVNNWEKIDGIWYFFDSSGYMQTGWKKIGTEWYYFNHSGAMKTGWLELGSKQYYLNSSGEMQTGLVGIGEKVYYFRLDGSWFRDFDETAAEGLLFGDIGKIYTFSDDESEEYDYSELVSNASYEIQSIRIRSDFMTVEDSDFVIHFTAPVSGTYELATYYTFRQFNDNQSDYHLIPCEFSVRNATSGDVVATTTTQYQDENGFYYNTDMIGADMEVGQEYLFEYTVNSRLLNYYRSVEYTDTETFTFINMVMPDCRYWLIEQ